MKTALVGVGNPILSDDAVGIIVARRIAELVSDDVRLTVIEAPVGGFELVEWLYGYQRAVILDAVVTEGGVAGRFWRLNAETVTPCEIPRGIHHVGLFEGLEMARRLCLPVPEQLAVYGIEVDDVTTFGTRLSASVERAIPYIAAEIAAREFGVPHAKTT